MWLYILAGPATHLLLLFFVYLISPNSLRPDIVIPDAFHNIEPIAAFAVANLWLLVFNIIPRKIQKPTGILYSDGYQLLRLPFAKPVELNDLERTLPRLEAFHFLQDGKTEEALTIYRALLEEFPEDKVLQHDIAIANLKSGQYEEALSTFTGLLTSEEFAKPELMLVLKNNIAWVSAVIGRQELFEQAERFSKEAYESAPKMSLFAGTRGSVLVRIGREREGVELLKKAFREQSISENRAAEACFIAIGESRLGNMDASRQWIAKARRESPNYRLIEMVEIELDLEASRALT